MLIAGRTIGGDGTPYVIAEIGVNHDGSLERCLELIDAAADAGADAIKLQLFDADRLLSRAARLAAYQRAAGCADPFEMLRAVQFGLDELGAAADHAHARGLHTLVTVFNVDLVEPAAALPWDAWKVASPDLVNRPLLEALAHDGRPLIVSTGAATLDEVAAALRWLGERPCALLHCVSSYPTPDEQAHLAGIAALRALRPLEPVGYSDHTTALDTGALAVAAGASILEKHLTWNRGAAGPDHAASLEPEGLREYVGLARRAAAMLGTPGKRVLEIERDVREAARQSIVAVRALPAGALLDAADLTLKRPGGGLPAEHLPALLGRRLARAVEADALLAAEDLA